MGKSRQRNKNPPAARKSAAKKLRPGVACQGHYRLGLDPTIFAALKKADAFLREIRNDITIPPKVVDGQSAVLTYLAYCSVMIGVVLADIAMSAVHGNDLPVLMKERLLVEYSAKAQYFNRYPDYALYSMTIGEVKGVLKKLKRSGGLPNSVINATNELAQLKAQFPQVATGYKTKAFVDIMLELGTGDDYAWLYGAPSALIHGDPEGMRTVFEVREDGYRHVVTSLPAEDINAWMVDAGDNTMMFMREFLNAYHPRHAVYNKYFDELDAEFRGLILKHPIGRDENVLKNIKTELDARAGQNAEDPFDGS